MESRGPYAISELPYDLDLDISARSIRFYEDRGLIDASSIENK